MATKWTSPTWRMPENSNQSKFDNYSLDFPGAVSQRISVTASDTILPNQSDPKMSISAWIYMDTSSSGISRTIFSSGKVGSGAMDYTFEVNNGFLFFKVRTTNVPPHYTTITGGTAISLNTWYHASVTWDGANLNLYLNSVVDATPVAATSFYATSNSSPMIGVREGGGYYSAWAGKLGQICYFDYALSETQVKYLYNNNAGGSTPNPQNPMAIPGNSPIAYYDLGGSSTGDAAASSPNTLTVPNSSVPSATVFDFSTSDVVESPHISIDSSFTVSAWINTTDTSTYGNIFSSDDFGSNRNWQFFRWNNKIRFLLRDSSGSSIYDSLATATETINDGKWHHVAATWDGTTNSNGISIYVDGDLSTQGTSSSTSLKNSVVTQKIGAGNTLWDFIGKISNCQLWNTNLSLSEVKTLYNNGVPLLTGTQPQAANLKAWYKLNIDTSTWNGSDWTIENNFTTPTYTEGLKFFGQYLGGSPNANYSGMRLTNQTISSDHVTYSFWYKRVIPTTGSSIGIVLTSGYLGGLNVVSGGGVQWFGDGATKYVNFSGNVGDGAWHHVLVYYPNTSTITHSDVKCYIDGVLQTNSYVGAGSSSGPVTEIRGTLLQSVPLQVELSNWSYFLSDQTGNIDTIYNGGTPGDISSLNPSVWLKYNSSTTSLTGAKGANYGVATDSSGNGNNGIIAGGFSSQSNTETAEIVTSNVLTGGKSSGMTTANLVNSDLERSIPYSSYSMDFDGLTDFIKTTSPTITSGAMSFSCWFKTSAAGNQVIWNSIDSTTAKSFLRISGTALRLKIIDGSGGNNNIDNTVTTADGNWHHIAFITDGLTTTNGVVVYLDGQELAVKGTLSNAGFASTTKNQIGAYAPNAQNFNGELSNPAFFNKVLTENEIASIYNGGVPNDISSLSPVAWWSFSGDSYYNGTDWICPDLVGSNNGDSDGTMGGDELVGDGPGSTSNGIATGMNIPGNLQGNAPNSSKNAFSVNMNAADRVEDVAPTP